MYNVHCTQTLQYNKIRAHCVYSTQIPRAQTQTQTIFIPTIQILNRYRSAINKYDFQIQIEMHTSTLQFGLLLCTLCLLPYMLVPVRDRFFIRSVPNRRNQLAPEMPILSLLLLLFFVGITDDDDQYTLHMYLNCALIFIDRICFATNFISSSPSFVIRSFFFQFVFALFV